MPDNADLIEKYELELQELIQRMHKEGISYQTICFVLTEVIKNLDLMAYCENWLAIYGQGKGLVAETI